MRPMRSGAVACTALILALASMPAMAQHAPGKAGNVVVVYRCTDAAGDVTFQNGKPCPKGQQQQTRKLPKPAPVRTPANAPASTSLPVTVVQAAPQAVERAPGAIARRPRRCSARCRARRSPVRARCRAPGARAPIRP